MSTLSPCEYYYGETDSTLWWSLPYEEALTCQIQLATTILEELATADFFTLDVERTNRIDRKIKHLKAELALGTQEVQK